MNWKEQLFAKITKKLASFSETLLLLAITFTAKAPEGYPVIKLITNGMGAYLLLNNLIENLENKSDSLYKKLYCKRILLSIDIGNKNGTIFFIQTPKPLITPAWTTWGLITNNTIKRTIIIGTKFLLNIIQPP